MIHTEKMKYFFPTTPAFIPPFAAPYQKVNATEFWRHRGKPSFVCNAEFLCAAGSGETFDNIKALHPRCIFSIRIQPKSNPSNILCILNKSTGSYVFRLFR